jgi:hypothetical protein
MEPLMAIRARMLSAKADAKPVVGC